MENFEKAASECNGDEREEETEKYCGGQDISLNTNVKCHETGKIRSFKIGCYGFC